MSQAWLAQTWLTQGHDLAKNMARALATSLNKALLQSRQIPPCHFKAHALLAEGQWCHAFLENALHYWKVYFELAC